MSTSSQPTIGQFVDPAAVWPRGAGRAAMQLLDVRAPVEVSRSALPGAIARAILDDDERRLVGTCYHQHGHDAAVALGLRLTAPHRQARVRAWQQVIDDSQLPVVLTCWRGGERSAMARQWLGGAVPRVRGGAKELRRYLLESLERRLPRQRLLVLAGLTGAGKTDALHTIAAAGLHDLHVLDLEHHAEHRGSAFGGLAQPQPEQATFENRVAVDLQLAGAGRTLVEDEARSVGRVLLPQVLWRAMQGAEMVVLEAPTAERVARIVRDYVLVPTAAEGRAAVRTRLDDALDRLHKRLGGKLQRQCRELLADADHDARWHRPEAHEPWVRLLLDRYYDRHYAYALETTARPVRFRGELVALRDWLARE